MADKWQQHQLWDNTYTIDDLADIHEILLIEAINKKRADDYARNQQESGGN